MKYIDLRKIIDRPYFTTDDIRLFGLNVYKYQLSLWQEKGYIIQLKRGVYAFSEYGKKLSGFELAQQIYSPSYISLESALSRYGLIPEFVPSTTSVTTRTTRQFTNILGMFSFRSIKKDLFWGYISQESEYGNYYFAEPEKAILDYLYLNSRVISTLEDIDAIRINYEEFLRIIDLKKFIIYAKAYQNVKVLQLAKNLISIARENVNT